MSEDRRLTLQKERGGYVDTNLLPAEGGCNLLCLTDRQVAIIRSFVFPMVRWPTRWLTPVHGELYDTDSDTLVLLADEIDDLDLEVNGGHNVPCQELADALGTLITIANSAGSVGSVLANIPDEDWLPSVAETPPEEDIPPEGFDTWDAYLTWKCQAAWAVWHEVDRVMTMLEGFYGLEVTASVIVPTIFAFTSISWVAVPISGVAILVVSILAMVAVWGSAVLIMDQMRNWWSDHQDAIVCQLYNSGDAATALTAIGDNIEDAIQAIEWGALLPFAGPLGDALGTVIGVFQNNSLVNPLFKLITGVVLIEVECPCEAPPAYWWHFTAGVEDWYFFDNSSGCTVTHQWQAAPSPADGDDIDAGCLEIMVDLPSGGYSFLQTEWRFDYAVGERPVAAGGVGLRADYYQSHQGGGVITWIVINYQEGGEDHASFGIGGAFQQQTVYCQPANYGKHISMLRLAAGANSLYRDPVTWRFDNVHVVGL